MRRWRVQQQNNAGRVAERLGVIDNALQLRLRYSER